MGLSEYEKIPLPSLSNTVEGYHATRKIYAEEVIRTGLFHSSINPGDWLGHGTYFWENNPSRAIQWAHEHYGKKESSVLKASIRLGKCLDLSNGTLAGIVKVAYDNLKKEYEKEGKKLPINDPDDPKNHKLDCAVMNKLPEIVDIDTIRAPFYEGNEIFPGSFLLTYSHIQIVVINNKNIIGEIQLYS